MSLIKKHIPLLFYWLVSILILTGCKKVETTRTYTVSNTISQNIIASDEVIINNELDQFVDDAITVLSNHNATIAGAYPPDSVSPSFIELTYSDKQYDISKARTGADSIHIAPGISWGTPGTTATLAFQDINQPLGYEVFYYSLIPPSSDTASLTFLGNISITNVHGGLLQNLTPGDSIVVHIRASKVSFTFNDQAALIQLFPISVNEIRTFTMSGNTIYATTRGDTSISGYSNVGSFGTNRLGYTYYSTITYPLVQNISNLSLSYNPLYGEKIIEGIPEPITSIYGVNSSGSAQASGSPYGFHISWTDNGVLGASVLPYYY
jgi:hypothetical protein